MAIRKERKDLFYALKGRIQAKLDYYNSPTVTSTCSQPARVCGRKEGYQEVIDMIDEMLNMDVMV
jgi:hypothetical protein